MFDKFGDYMFYLLNAPLKKLKSGKNQLKIFFSVVGQIFDEMLEDILKYRRQKIISEAEPIMLEVIGQDRDMFRLQGETMEQYRKRLMMKAIIAELGGTNTGLLLAIETLGYPECNIEPLYKTDRKRWAEIYIDILIIRDIKYDAILYEVLKVKTARTLPFFRFHREEKAKEIKNVAAFSIGNVIKVKAQAVKKINAYTEDKSVAALFLEQRISVKANDEIKKNEIYCLKEDGQMVRVFTANGSVVRTE